MFKFLKIRLKIYQKQDFSAKNDKNFEKTYFLTKFLFIYDHKSLNINVSKIVSYP